MTSPNTIPDSGHATVIRLSPEDNVLIAIRNLAVGAAISFDGSQHILTTAVGLGHKIAARNIVAGEKIIKCHVSIGSATQTIEQGEHIHLHNMKSDYLPTYSRGDELKSKQVEDLS